MKVSGTTSVTVQVAVAGVGSTLPAGSMAVTVIVCMPRPRPLNTSPLVHGAAGALSIWQVNVLPASVEVKTKLAVVSVTVPVVPLTIVVSGDMVSMVNMYAAGVGSTEPPGEVACTWKVYMPSVSVVMNGDVHGANAAGRIRHSKVLPVIVAVNTKVTAGTLPSRAGPDTIVVSTAGPVPVSVVDASGVDASAGVSLASKLFAASTTDASAPPLATQSIEAGLQV